MSIELQNDQGEPWKMPPHALTFPVVLDGGEKLHEIPLRPISVAEHRAALAKAGKDDDAQFEALVEVATGLPPSVLEQLKQPDYVSLVERIYNYIKMPPSFFTGVAPESPDDFALLVPIRAFVDGVPKIVDRLQIEVPAMKVSKMMRKLKTANDRADFVTAHCVGLSVPDVQSLSLPDWSHLQERLNDFLNKPGAFFQSATST
ncbi:phage tail assembly protein [Pseudomonas frederiksbergensis]|nr:phage tail assembly protein [Pseudomonas frederiksbergensis]